MDFEIIIKPDAEIDLDEAVLWQETELSGLGIRFYCFENALDRIVKNPNAFIEIPPAIRRIIIKQFPYKVFYSVSGNKIFVIGECMLKEVQSSLNADCKEYNTDF